MNFVRLFLILDSFTGKAQNFRHEATTQTTLGYKAGMLQALCTAFIYLFIALFI